MLRVSSFFQAPYPHFYVLSTAALSVGGGLQIFQEDLGLFNRLKAQSKDISDPDSIKTFIDSENDRNRLRTITPVQMTKKEQQAEGLRLIWRVSDLGKITLPSFCNCKLPSRGC